MRPISKLFGKDKKSAVVSDAAEPAVTLADFFDAKYYAFAKATKRRSQLDYYVFNKHIRTSLGQKPLRDITSEDLDSWVLHQIDAGYKPATVNKHSSMLNRILNIAVHWGYLDKNVFKGAAIRRETRESW